MDINKLVKPNIRSLRAYQAEEVPCKVKLDANESPYGTTVLKSIETNKYPDPEAKALRKLFARDCKVKAENVLHGNGSDELISCLITTFGGPVLYPVPTFSMYGIIAQAQGEKKIEVPLDKHFDIDLGKMLPLIKSRNPKLIFLSSPNNPTGNCYSSDRIIKIIKQSKGLVIVDEAYQAFSGKNEFLPLLKKYRNLVVLRTLSKVGMAALRTGFMIAGKEVVDEVNKVRLPFNVNSLSQKVAVDTLQKKAQLRSGIRSIISERKKTMKEMIKMDRVGPYPSDANFIFFKVDGAGSIFKKLLSKGVLVRNMTGAVENCLRVTIGTPKENAFFLKSLKQVL